MAFESGELAAEVIVRHQDKLTTNAVDALCKEYAAGYAQKFNSRLRICGWLRRLAFKPRLARVGITICGASNHFRNRIARATRSSNRANRGALRAG
jgi:hypothetical protein